MIAAAAAAFGVLPVAAQAQESTSLAGVYGTLGYSHQDGGPADVGTIQGRLGYRFNNYVGVEGELGTGVKSDHVTVAPGVSARVKLRNEEAAYAVGFLPVNPKLDLLARVGYGHTSLRTSAAGVSVKDGIDSWNYGAGAQYHFDAVNGIRAEYTRKDFRGGDGHADVWSVAYARRF
jgi:hypothetical protein